MSALAWSENGAAQLMNGRWVYAATVTCNGKTLLDMSREDPFFSVYDFASTPDGARALCDAKRDAVMVGAASFVEI